MNKKYWFIRSKWRTTKYHKDFSEFNFVSEIHPAQFLRESNESGEEEHMILFYAEIDPGDLKKGLLESIMENYGEM